MSLVEFVVVIKCGLHPTPPSNSVPVITPGIDGETSYNATMTVVCIEGYSYIYSGSETVSCGVDGLWEEILGKCENSKPPDLTTAIVGSVVTSAVVVSSAVGIFIFMRRRKKHKDDATRNLDQIDRIKMGGSSIPVEMDYQNGPADRSKKGQESHFANTISDVSANTVDINVDENCYENIQSIRTKDIKVEDLFDFVLQRRSKSSLYEDEYKQAAITVTKSKDVAMQAENKDKNRYKGMVPYDDNRVKLHVWDADMETDYINASFIDGFNRRQAYVAAQG
ncbi:hypothetical protein CHS0354_010657 [Potamilus streckersoni]|uniref:protein-tyrosine-phosphatase n=1 Tax=Potamilus streckersoni TaxID=2493646 RepID=A0AAE0TD17_9BIVA|nr:hypothetical protein CHS0354_010657 [Potamilus streckersoni]